MLFQCKLCLQLFIKQLVLLILSTAILTKCVLMLISLHLHITLQVKLVHSHSIEIVLTNEFKLSGILKRTKLEPKSQIFMQILLLQ